MWAAGAGATGLRAVVISAAVLTGCDATPETSAPASAAVATVPPGWVTVQSAGRDLQLMLPPWLVPFDTEYAIYANEAPAPGGRIAVELMASGPGAFQPAPNESVLDMVNRNLVDAGSGVPVVTTVSLPAGPAIRYERVDRARTPDEWHVLVYGITTPTGVAYLQIDGSPDGWRRRASDFEWIAALLRAR